MLKKTESEETIGFFAIILSLVVFQFGEARRPSPPPLATPMGKTLEKLQVTGYILSGSNILNFYRNE